jgi:hypothetical protein
VVVVMMLMLVPTAMLVVTVKCVAVVKGIDTSFALESRGQRFEMRILYCALQKSITPYYSGALQKASLALGGRGEA